MSTDALPEILALLRKQKNLSVKVTFKTVKTGKTLTTISFKETGIQPHPDSSRSSSKKPEDGGGKARKSPSRLARDRNQHNAFLSRKAGPGEPDPSAAVPAPSSNVNTTHRFATPGHRRRTVGAGDEKNWGSGSWEPGDGIEENFIPQLDGKVDESEDEKKISEDETDDIDEMDLRNAEVEEEDIGKEEVEEEKILDEKANESENKDLFCIHNNKINLSDYRPDCKKCRKNYYKMINSDCPHYVKRENCFSCYSSTDGWMYKK